MVPNGWSQLKGKEITDKITKGSSPKWQGFDYQKEGTLFVTSENVRDGFLDISSPKYLPLEFNQKLKNSQLEKGDILINIVGASIGRSCQFDIENQSANINQAVCLFRTNELVESEFIFQFLQHSTTINKLLGTQSESARPNLSLSDMRDFLFSIPPLPEQRKIAKILSTWDKAISTTERLIDNSKQQKKALMQQLLTGAHTQRKRLLDDSGKPFEGEWEEVKLGDVVLTGRGYAFKSTQYSESGYKIVRVTNVDSSGKIDLSDCVYIPDETAIEFKKYELYQDDVLLVMVGATAGKLGFVSKDTLPALLNQNMWSLRTKDSERLCQIFLRHVIYQVVAKYLLSQQGSARGFFTQKTFESVKFSIPTIKEQQKVASVLTNADKEIELLEQQLADLKQEKKALMQQLLTGKRRVKVDDKEVA